MRRHGFALIQALMLCAAPVQAPAGDLDITVSFAPPALPVYVQPPIPMPGYLWVPGYWAWDRVAGDYYWVPGTWLQPPVAGYLWTPGYWGWAGGVYVWHPGYWGPHVGFYGGINYGHGYPGTGFRGGYWHGGQFFYNRAVLNLGHTHIASAYSEPQLGGRGSRVSFNGGAGGARVRPAASDRTALRDHHVLYTPLQHQQEVMAAGNHDLHARVNGGRPTLVSTPRAGEFARPPAPPAHPDGRSEHSAGGPGHSGERHADPRPERPAH